MNSTNDKPTAQYKNISVRPHAHRNAEQAIAVKSLGGKKVTLADFASDAINKAALPILKTADIEPATE
jgi:hypothetical protein